MPQELHVLRCYSCAAYQVHIVKKASKWDCKLCGERQSLNKVYARGSGKDCRLYVQQFNQARLETSQNILETIGDISSDTNDFQNNSKLVHKDWEQFIVKSDTSETEDTDNPEVNNYTFERPAKKRRLKQSRIVKMSSVKSDELPAESDLNDLCNTDVKMVVCSKPSFWEESIEEDVFADLPKDTVFELSSNSNQKTMMANHTPISAKEKIVKESQTFSKWGEFCENEEGNGSE